MGKPRSVHYVGLKDSYQEMGGNAVTAVPSPACNSCSKLLDNLRRAQATSRCRGVLRHSYLCCCEGCRPALLRILRITEC